MRNLLLTRFFHNKSSYAHHCESICENCKTLLMRQKRRYYTYILASKSRVLYTGVTGFLMSRVLRHKQGEGGCFTRKYRVNRLVWFQSFELVSAAIAKETEIKAWRREKKIRLVEENNPAWEDLAADWGTRFLPQPEKAGSSPLKRIRNDSL